MSKVAQNERLLKAMQRGEKLTALNALNDYGVFRLASRICDIRKHGYPVQSKMVSVKNRFGEEVSVKEYWIDE